VSAINEAQRDVRRQRHTTGRAAKHPLGTGEVG